MDEIMKLELQWQALRYAVDMIDIAWSMNPEGYDGKLREQKEIEMKAHRRTLCEWQDEVLNKKYELEK